MSKFYVYFRDTDPDTGLLTQVTKLCECDVEKRALWIREALAQYSCDDPTRDYWVTTDPEKTEHIILCADAEQLEKVAEFQLWVAKKGVRCVACFDIEDLNRVLKIYKDANSKYMTALVGESETWKNLMDWEVRMSTFDDELDFDTIYSLVF